MPEAETAAQSLELDLPDEAATAALAGALAACARRGDVIALTGELGTGKTTLARAFVQALGGTEEVPSPTFTLVQDYDVAGGVIHHFDLFRLSAPEEVFELGYEDALADGISLVEWPERLGPLLPADRLEVELRYGASPGQRRARLTAFGAWRAKLERVRLG